MSSDYLKLVPADAHFLPTAAAREEAVAALEALLPEGSECSARDFGHVAFIDQGENLEAILCPACSCRLGLFDGPNASAISEWWHGAIDEVESTEGVVVTMPCCSRTVPLASLRFDWPAEFARFELSILDPGIQDPLSADQLAQFEKILECELRQVRAHY